MDGEPKARSTMWPARSAQLRLALFELARPALPPLGTAGQGGRYRGYTARCVRGRLGGTSTYLPGAGPTVRLVARALCAPRTSVSATLLR